MEVAVHLQRGEADVDPVNERRAIAKTDHGQKPEAGFSQGGSADSTVGKRRGGLLRCSTFDVSLTFTYHRWTDNAGRCPASPRISRNLFDKRRYAGLEGTDEVTTTPNSLSVCNE